LRNLHRAHRGELHLLHQGTAAHTQFENIAASNAEGTTFESMVSYINAFVGISVAMIALQLLGSLLGLPFNKAFVPLRTLPHMQS
jgi:hypothetical protein